MLHAAREIERIEAVDARPEGEIGVQGLLGLEPDELGDRVDRCAHGSFEQELPGERGASEAAVVQNVGDDARQYGGTFAPMAGDRTEYDAVVVGAGFAGMFVAYRLHELGLRYRVYEVGDGVGGTWF